MSELAGSRCAGRLRDTRRGRAWTVCRPVHAVQVAVAPASASPAREAAAPAFLSLTKRELEVLSLLARGYANKGIARELFVSEKTAKTHVSNILAKLGVTDRTQAAVYAVRTGLVPVERRSAS